MTRPLKRIDDMAYAPEHGFRGLADLFLPEKVESAPVALVIHGGGWNAMDKRSLTAVSKLMADCGYAAFSINYRLLDDAPWPACGDDCLAAARFLLAAEHPALKPLDTSKVVVVGASAGGHLALWTGLSLPASQVRAIISIAGPSDLERRARQGRKSDAFWSTFLGGKVTPEALRNASPVHHVCHDSPPLLCIHSTHDELVLMGQSEIMMAAYAAVGARGELAAFPGAGKQHGIWKEATDETDTAQRTLVTPVTEAIQRFLATLHV